MPIPDQTIPLSIQIPPEFIALCEARQTTASQVLRGLIADLCELKNYEANPRDDRYNSNGSDERLYAEQWFDRAYPDWEVAQ